MSRAAHAHEPPTLAAFRRSLTLPLPLTGTRCGHLAGLLLQQASGNSHSVAGPHLKCTRLHFECRGGNALPPEGGAIS